MRTSIQQRCAGALWGLAAGDKNGGPIRMAVLLGESLCASSKYNREEIISKYMNWYLDKDEERCFDTGNTFLTIFSYMNKGVANEDATKKLLKSQPSIAGVNAAHRAVPISMAAFISDESLAATTYLESSITHIHPLSVQTATVVNKICRDLITGMTWEEALEAAKSMEGLDIQVRSALVVAQDTSKLSAGGLAPEVLKAAIYFTNQTKTSTFEEVLNLSLAFAREDNFCPVIVGAFCGALLGKEAIPNSELTHHRRPLQKRIDTVATTLASQW